MKGDRPLFIFLCDDGISGDIFDIRLINQLEASFLVYLFRGLILLDDGSHNDSFQLLSLSLNILD